MFYADLRLTFVCPTAGATLGPRRAPVVIDLNHIKIGFGFNYCRTYRSFSMTQSGFRVPCEFRATCRGPHQAPVKPQFELDLNFGL